MDSLFFTSGYTVRSRRNLQLSRLFLLQSSVVSVRTDTRRKASATSLREVGYFSAKLKRSKNSFLNVIWTLPTQIRLNKIVNLAFEPWERCFKDGVPTDTPGKGAVRLKALC